MLMALSIVPLNSLCQDNWNKVQDDLFGLCDTIGIHFVVMSYQWHCHWYHCTSKANKPKEVQHDFFGYVMPLSLVLASHDADCISGAIAFVRLRLLRIRWNMTFSHVTPLVLVSIAHNTNDVLNGTSAFDRSRWLKWRETDFSGHVK